MIISSANPGGFADPVAPVPPAALEPDNVCVCAPAEPVFPTECECDPDDDIEVSMVWWCDPPEPVVPDTEPEWVCDGPELPNAP